MLERPDYRWYVKNLQVGTGPVNSVYDGHLGFDAFWLIYIATEDLEKPVEVGSLAGWPLSRYFESVGIVAMHTNLTNQDEDVLFAFKSTPDPLTEISHGDADQNSFYLHAYNKPLAIVGGYHSFDYWEYQEHSGDTKHKNTLLFDGIGQLYEIYRGYDEYDHVEAEIIKYEDHTYYTFAIGEASKAYTTKVPSHLDLGGGQGVGVSVDRFRRYAIMVRNKKLPYAVIVDDTATPEEKLVSWILHSRKPMELYEASKRVKINYDEAHCNVYLFCDEDPVEFVQDEYELPTDKLEQWNFKMTLPKTKKQRIAAVLVPYKNGYEDLIPANVTGRVTDDGNGYELRVGGDIIKIDFVNDKVYVNDAGIDEWDIDDSLGDLRTKGLLKAYPNPSKGTVRIVYRLDEDVDEIFLRIYSTGGKLVREYKGDRQRGFRQIIWDGEDGSGNRVSSGVYTLRLIIKETSGAPTTREGSCVIAR